MLAEQADLLVVGADAVLVVDDTGVPKKGTRSVGVAPQYCGELGKQSTCRSLASLTLARHEVPLLVGLRLFLPRAWTNEPAGCAAVGMPEIEREPRTKPEIALAELDSQVPSRPAQLDVDRAGIAVTAVRYDPAAAGSRRSLNITSTWEPEPSMARYK